MLPAVQHAAAPRPAPLTWKTGTGNVQSWLPAGSRCTALVPAEGLRWSAGRLIGDVSSCPAGWRSLEGRVVPGPQSCCCAAACTIIGGRTSAVCGMCCCHPARAEQQVADWLVLLLAGWQSRMPVGVSAYKQLYSPQGEGTHTSHKAGSTAAGHTHASMQYSPA